MWRRSCAIANSTVLCMGRAKEGIKAASFFEMQIDRNGKSIMLCTRCGAQDLLSEPCEEGLFRSPKIALTRKA
jgi:hypothetical protein